MNGMDTVDRLIYRARGNRYATLPGSDETSAKSGGSSRRQRPRCEVRMGGSLNVGKMGEGGQYAGQEETRGDVWKRDEIEG